MKHPKVTFYPWEGKNYNGEGFRGKKVLILGESHYGDFTPEEHCTTTHTVERYLGRRPIENGTYNWKPFFTKITKICLDKDNISKEDKDCFWDSVVFYNYVTECAGEDHRPKSNQWENSKKSFIKVINFYEPDVILMLGDAVWNHTPMENWNLDKPNLGYYTLDSGKKVFVSSVYHPSSRHCYGTDEYDSKKIFKRLMKR